jgi:outer membrane protein assembly factor BamD (BamD/ComL family)
MNDLFAEAMDAKTQGDKSRAVAALQRFETLYPASPLAESATVERMKLLASTNPKAAAAVAKRYLAHYPDGFARDVAEGIVAKSP